MSIPIESRRRILEKRASTCLFHPSLSFGQYKLQTFSCRRSTFSLFHFPKNRIIFPPPKQTQQRRRGRRAAAAAAAGGPRAAAAAAATRSLPPPLPPLCRRCRVTTHLPVLLLLRRLPPRLRRSTRAPRQTPSSSGATPMTLTAPAPWRGREASTLTARPPRRGRGRDGKERKKERREREKTRKRGGTFPWF